MRNQKTSKTGLTGNNGFTIIELMMVVAIVAIMAAFAGPSFSTMINNNRITTQTNQFILALQIARNEAVKRGRPISVTAIDSSAAANEWGPGWQVLDENGNLIQNFDAIPSGLTLDSVGNNNTFVFDGTGTVDNNDSLTVCKSGLDGRSIVITNTGRTRLQTGITCA